ncbi:MAG: U32 family peptidase [Muribaculaceae bacterium]|nr:U32 family peptidase [Muribaculaceae bacterium]
MVEKKRKIELLAPARDADTAIEAILHGADAVYMGAPSHGARSAATNSIDDIRRVVEFAHLYNVRVYITVNTIVYESELKHVENMITELYRIGVDALIVQDMSVLEMNIPPIALHASTQCDTRSAAKAEFLQAAGFSQIVLARELTLKEISEIHSKVNVPLEVFVHGALCVSFSGYCQASLLATGRSANRGECAQMCRLPYDLCDERGNIIIKGKHLLSLKDMSRIDHLQQLLDAGASSFKIEGRLKSPAYVKTTVAAYRRELDRIIENNPDRFERSSLGVSELTFAPELSDAFNRGFTEYFLTDRKQSGIASFDTPKVTGTPIGKVKSVRDNILTVTTDVELSNGDGLGYFDESGNFTGFRLNKVEGNRLILRRKLDIRPGTVIYRNRNKQFDDLMAGRTAVRYIPVEMTLRMASELRVALDISISDNCVATAVLELDKPLDTARTSQTESRRNLLSKLGDTVYRLSHLNDGIGELFLPASLLATLRRSAVKALDSARKAAYPREYRREREANLRFPERTELQCRDNVANSLARKFYLSAGITSIAPAMEVSRPDMTKEHQVMETRYCLRRELGACLKTKSAGKLPDRLYLVSGKNRYRLQFDCDSCMMRVIRPAD